MPRSRITKGVTTIGNHEPRISRRGAMAVVFSSDMEKVLLLRRGIFILWDLPGGGIEKGETPEAAAIRECMEETGYKIEIERLVGIYQHQSVYGLGDQLTYAFRAHVIGGVPRRFGLKVTKLSWYNLSNLPRGFQPLHKKIVLDALEEPAKPFQRRIDFPLWKLYPARVAFVLTRIISNLLRWLLKFMRTSF